MEIVGSNTIEILNFWNSSKDSVRSSIIRNGNSKSEGKSKKNGIKSELISANFFLINQQIRWEFWKSCKIVWKIRIRNE